MMPGQGQTRQTSLLVSQRLCTENEQARSNYEDQNQDGKNPPYCRDVTKIGKENNKGLVTESVRNKWYKKMHA
jgi:hypothetical protein